MPQISNEVLWTLHRNGQEAQAVMRTIETVGVEAQRDGKGVSDEGEH